MSQNFVNALRNEISAFGEDYRWYANTKDGEGATITYSFDTETFWGENAGYWPFSDAEKAKIPSILAKISAVVDIHFVQVSGTADFYYGRYDMKPGVNGVANWLFTEIKTGEVNPGDNSIGARIDDGLSLSSAKAQGVFLHETLHVIGLDHPHESTDPLSKSEDKRTNTIMSYTFDKVDVNNLGFFDIAALQAIYGPAKAKMDANTYKFGSNKLIWDGGGTDTITASSAKSKVVIDLTDGSWNYIGKKASSILAKDQVYIGEHTIIERATGSRYDDKLYGNSVDNLIRGGNGNDYISGRDGNDDLRGDAGNDKLYGGAGDDKIYGGAGNDFLQGQVGADHLFGGAGKDKFAWSSYDEMGTIDTFDFVRDFSRKDDKLDLSRLDANAGAAGRQKLTFLGNATDDAKLSTGAARQFYYNTVERELHFDSNGDGAADYAIGISGLASMKSTYFML